MLWLATIRSVTPHIYLHTHRVYLRNTSHVLTHTHRHRMIITHVYLRNTSHLLTHTHTQDIYNPSVSWKYFTYSDTHIHTKQDNSNPSVSEAPQHHTENSCLLDSDLDSESVEKNSLVRRHMCSNACILTCILLDLDSDSECVEKNCLVRRLMCSWMCIMYVYLHAY